MISVVIPCFNEEKYIGRTLGYISRVKGIETIISDGKSTDKTIAVARPHVTKVVVNKHKSISHARNLGAKAAKGDILVFLDADVAIFDANKFFAEVERVFKDPSIVAGTVKVHIMPDEERISDRIFQFMVNLSMVIVKGGRGECIAIRKKAYMQVGGFDDKLFAGEDFELFSRLKRIGKIHCFKDLIVFKSSRRYRKYGYLKILSLYFVNYISATFLKRSFSKEWVPVR